MNCLTFKQEIETIENLKNELAQTGYIQAESSIEQSVLLEALNCFEEHCRKFV